jgi:prepilin-type N-terminal cleavage/methylation domain-containing protein
MNDFSLHTQHPDHKQKAFTLIELLVVIAIIAILASLLIPAGQNAINSSKKTTAKNQAVQIATALTAYETEYGHLPSVTDNASITAILCTTNDATNNPRALVFLDSSPWRPGKGGTNGGQYLDPWSNAYSIALDTNYVNTLSSMPSQSNSGGAVNYNATLTKHIGVWTVWTNKSSYYLIDSWD